MITSTSTKDLTILAQNKQQGQITKYHISEHIDRLPIVNEHKVLQKDLGYQWSRLAT
jgi:hypothetical protein